MTRELYIYPLKMMVEFSLIILASERIRTYRCPDHSTNCGSKCYAKADPHATAKNKILQHPWRRVRISQLQYSAVVLRLEIDGPLPSFMHVPCSGMRVAATESVPQSPPG